ncbi:unnamed protein product, partial [Mesorhabditis belari]|uniref:FAD dependent oxidoreductase domain-containing protein n=1 Tax=Mesorhabditis belari TaxID=2138241 RepID=A0AAF3F074_9BILA
MPKIVVVGAGIIGLSQACILQEKFPDAEITIVAGDVSPNITSDIAAGFWHPYLLGDDIPKDTLKRWLGETFDYILRFARSHPTHGAMIISGYEFNRKALKKPEFADFFLQFRELSPKEVLEARGKEAYPVEQAWFYTTVFLETTLHLKYLFNKYLSNGGLLERRWLKSIDELGEKYDLIFNCTGLGANKLVDDFGVFPTRGQIIRVRCPEVKHFFIDEETYCLPNSETTVLGGTAEKNDHDLLIRPATAKWILEENIKKIPALKNAEIVSHKVGLRPTRSAVRLETEYRTIGKKRVPIIHNYGHGGSGVTLFYGCALDGAKLAANVIQKSKI